MLANELQDAWNRAALQHNQKQSLPVPNRLENAEVEFLMGLYPREEFDLLCQGVTRHEKFAKWAVEHYGLWSTFIERITMEYYSACSTAAQSYPLSKVTP